MVVIKFKYLLKRSENLKSNFSFLQNYISVQVFKYGLKHNCFDLPHFRAEFESFWYHIFEELNCYCKEFTKLLLRESQILKSRNAGTHYLFWCISKTNLYKMWAFENDMKWNVIIFGLIHFHNILTSFFFAIWGKFVQFVFSFTFIIFSLIHFYWFLKILPLLFIVESNYDLGQIFL